jgi:hypothetical protein
MADQMKQRSLQGSSKLVLHASILLCVNSSDVDACSGESGVRACPMGRVLTDTPRRIMSCIDTRYWCMDSRIRLGVAILPEGV